MSYGKKEEKDENNIVQVSSNAKKALQDVIEALSGLSSSEINRVIGSARIMTSRKSDE